LLEAAELVVKGSRRHTPLSPDSVIRKGKMQAYVKFANDEASASTGRGRLLDQPAATLEGIIVGRPASISVVRFWKTYGSCLMPRDTGI
jgi:hypothetical protein